MTFKVVLLLFLLLVSPVLSAEELLVNELARRSFLYFEEQADPVTGLIPDRAPANGGVSNDCSSIAATGFGLVALVIGVENNWMPKEEALRRTKQTLNTLTTMPHEKGFFYHYVHKSTGKRIWSSEISSIDTALLLAGVLTAASYWNNEDVSTSASYLYHRVEWPWMLDENGLLSHGWTPERGFISASWDNYSEHLILQKLATESPTHPIKPTPWVRGPIFKINGQEFIGDGPLFIHQFSHAFIDFRGTFYWDNSVSAIKSQILELQHKSQTYPWYEHVWGLSSSDSEFGYANWGGPNSWTNGTVVPYALAASLPFLPVQTQQALEYMRENYPKAWVRYGFVDAFNPATHWYAKDVVGIDVGITLLMLENHRSGLVWNLYSP